MAKVIPLFKSGGITDRSNYKTERSTFAKSMNLVTRHIHIRKIFAALLLCIFALSITPTRYLHRLFANHQDFAGKTLPGPRPQLSVAGINCHCETNVVIAPYTVQPSPVITYRLPDFTRYNFPDAETPVYSGIFSFGLRGPPLAA